MEVEKCNFYANDNYVEYIVEYRGDFIGQINKVKYACGDAITSTLGIVAVKEEMLQQLIKDVPAILFVDFREIFILEDMRVSYSPQSTSNIIQIKSNPYLNLSGTGVLVGIVDTGIDYLNEEFIREDGTTRIEAIWDQTIANKDSSDEVFIGTVYNNGEINNALDAKKNGSNPYDVVPSKDTLGHGTQMASIVGARGYNKQVEGVANDCNYVIVKLLEAQNFKQMLSQNNINNIPVYNIAEIIAGLEYLRKYAVKSKKPMVILLPLGSTDYTHGGNTILARYINNLSTFKGIVVVTGTGNQGQAAGHVSGYINNKGEVKTVELLVDKPQRRFSFKIYIKKPNKITINIIAPSGQASGFIPGKIQQKEDVYYVLEDTKLQVQYYIPDNISGMQIIFLIFTDIKPGLWNLQLKGEYITDGRFNMWLPPSEIISEGTRFIAPDPYITLTAPATTKKALAVAFYNQIEDSIVAESGKGYPLNYYIKPDLAAPGVNILTSTIGNETKPMSGSSVAAAIAAGCCILLFQWGIVNKNDPTMFATTVIGYLVEGVSRRVGDTYPNPEWGYGKLDFSGVFKSLSGDGVGRSFDKDDNHRLSNTIESSEYYIKNLFIRIPQEMEEKIDV